MDADELVALEIALGGHEAVNRLACPARQALDLIADKWSVLVLAAVGAGVYRSGELARRIEGITRKMLTQTLRSLERNGLIDRHIYPEVPPRVDYHLTELAVSLLPIVCALCHWSEVNMAEVERARARYDRSR